jgi:Fe-S-cluster-containing hydrogenase component 2
MKDQNDCMACLSFELDCAAAFYKNEDTTTQNFFCIQITSKQDKTKVVVCVQCGKCAKSREAKAMIKNSKDVFVIDKKICVNCGKCIEVCPFNLIAKAKERDSPTKCIAAESAPKTVQWAFYTSKGSAGE